MKKAAVLKVLLLGAFFLAVIPASIQQSSRRKGGKTSRIRVLSKDQQFQVNETLRLLSEGDKLETDELSHQDFVLVIGNTGAGKTTMTKFLAQTHLLEAYNTFDRFLIRDRHGKISENSTIVSKTIFPDLIVDNETDTAFYDLPGFQDTRNASVEIANSWFIKKVADRAQGVKLIFVVNYSSMKSGETRTDFKTLLEHGIDLVKDPAHFANSTAMLVTKVESSRSDEEVMEGIQNFLESALHDLPEIFADQERFNRAADLVENFLSEDSEGHLNRIAFFRQPNQTGALVSMPWMMEQKEWIQSIISNMTYTEKTEDFGISISANARVLSNKLSQDLTLKITSAVNQTAFKVHQYFQIAVKASPPSEVGTLYKLQQDFETSLNTINPALNRTDFYDSLESILTPLNIPDLAPEFSEMKNRDENLRFFEQIRNAPILSPLHQWMSIMRDAARATKIPIRNLAVVLNSNVQEDMDRLGSQFDQSIRRRVNTSSDDKETLQQLLTLSLDIQSHNTKTLSSQTFNEFFRNIQALFPYNNGSSYSFQEMQNDMSFRDSPDFSSPFRLVNWVRPMELAFLTLQQGIRSLEGKIKDEEHRQAEERMKQAMNDLQDNMNRTLMEEQVKFSKIQNETRLEKELLETRMKEERDKFNADLDNQTAENRARLEEMEQQNREAQAALESRLNNQKKEFESTQAAFSKQNEELAQQLRDEREENAERLKEQQQQQAAFESNMQSIQTAIEEERARNRELMAQFSRQKKQTCIFWGLACW